MWQLACITHSPCSEAAWGPPGPAARTAVGGGGGKGATPAPPAPPPPPPPPAGRQTGGQMQNAWHQMQPSTGRGGNTHSMQRHTSLPLLPSRPTAVVPWMHPPTAIPHLTSQDPTSHCPLPIAHCPLHCTHRDLKAEATCCQAVPQPALLHFGAPGARQPIGVRRLCRRGRAGQ